jgi:hypothetical protein
MQEFQIWFLEKICKTEVHKSEYNLRQTKAMIVSFCEQELDYMRSNLGTDHMDKRFLGRVQDLRTATTDYGQQHIYTWETRQDKTC